VDHTTGHADKNFIQQQDKDSVDAALWQQQAFA